MKSFYKRDTHEDKAEKQNDLDSMTVDSAEESSEKRSNSDQHSFYKRTEDTVV